ncbi:hypothetical protein [Nonomuraea sp. NPDC049695]|uniref:hypothetical protein n=1 Tax=Nonomuraea sp. NPDC049695 TaxID=3154734 RepID=UPI003437A217
MPLARRPGVDGPVIAGELVDLAQLSPEGMCVLYAEPDDDPAHVFPDDDQLVIEAEHRARRLLQLDTSRPFLLGEDLKELTALGHRLYG